MMGERCFIPFVNRWHCCQILLKDTQQGEEDRTNLCLAASAISAFLFICQLVAVQSSATDMSSVISRLSKSTLSDMDHSSNATAPYSEWWFQLKYHETQTKWSQSQLVAIV